VVIILVAISAVYSVTQAVDHVQKYSSNKTSITFTSRSVMSACVYLTCHSFLLTGHPATLHLFWTWTNLRGILALD